MAENQKLPFTKINYVIMIAGILVLILGFIFMSMDTEQHGFGFMGLTLGPVVVMLGFVIEFIAIFYKPKNKKATE